MALTLITETGAGVTGANSYASQAEGDAYHEARLHSAGWTAATPTQKDQALVQATRFLDGNVQWQGQRISIDQALAWPRHSVTWDGHLVPDNSLPKPIKDAVCELALHLLAADLQADQSGDNISELNLGQSALVIKFKDTSETRRIPLAIGELLQGLGSPTCSGGINSRKVTR